MSDYVLNDDGTANFEFDNFTRVLKRPTLGQYRQLVEGLGALRDEVLNKITTDDATQKQTASVQIELVVDWFDNTFRVLAGEGFPRKTVPATEETPEHEVVDEDKLPSWLISAELVAELIGHWQTVPSHRGDR